MGHEGDACGHDNRQTLVEYTSELEEKILEESVYVAGWKGKIQEKIGDNKGIG